MATHQSDLLSGPTAWWRHQMEIFSALLVLCVGNSPVTGEFPSQRPVRQSFDVFFDIRLNNRLNKQSRRRRFETLSRSLCRHCNGITNHKGVVAITPDQTNFKRTSITCLYCDVISLFLATGVVILHILSWRDREHKERRQARKNCVASWCRESNLTKQRNLNHYYKIANPHKHIWF